MDGSLFISRRAGDSLEMGPKWEAAAQGHESPSETAAGGAKGQTRLQQQTAKKKGKPDFIRIAVF